MADDAGSKRALPSAATSVASYLRATPAGARVFLEHRMACVGCSLADFDTLADAAREYRLPLDAFLTELGRAASAAEPPNHDASRRET